MVIRVTVLPLSGAIPPCLSFPRGSRAVLPHRNGSFAGFLGNRDERLLEFLANGSRRQVDTYSRSALSCLFTRVRVAVSGSIIVTSDYIPILTLAVIHSVSIEM